MMTRSLILALSLAVAGTPAIAAERPTAEVRIADLDLATAQGQQRLETRVKSAARSLCDTGERGVAAMTRQSQCIAEVLASARPQADQAIARAGGGTRLALLMVRAAR
ncbi:UrcA family protein [Sphingopyxis sp. PET50]|uniref:UrcA family protein n=1 Tax=Sphingopyxis sp. PET50 TaxID=2976533 RepID=UPI0021AFD67B|nr:UrcA family protein [Sphingopyxis sp. PET50]